MARALNHSRSNAADRMRQHGTERIDDYSVPPEFFAPPKPRRSKAALRAEIDAATAAITRIVRCRCGHSATVALPPSRLGAKLRCSKCGSIAQIEKEKPAERNAAGSSKRSGWQAEK